MAGKKLSIATKPEAADSAPAKDAPSKKPAAAKSAPAAPDDAASSSSDAPPSSWSVLGRIGLVLAAFASALALAWTYFGGSITGNSEFYVDPQNIVLTPNPEWIRSPILSEIVKKAGLREPLWILDPQLSERLAQEFSLHPWVERVSAVRLRRPSVIEIDLVYRRPAVMVEVPSGRYPMDVQGKRVMVEVPGGLYPVDVQGVLLPTADFSPVEAARYPRLGGATATPGPVGAVWGDPVVVDGAKLGALIAPHWEAWRLFRIAAAERNVLDPLDARPEFILVTKSNKTRILWGTAPGVELSSQPAAEEKLQRLERYVADLGSLDHSTEPREIDLRPADRLRVTPTVAASPRFGEAP
ncbi:MAG TPA: hypothetical protein VGE52_11350 [Pirellulales bacterium]